MNAPKARAAKQLDEIITLIASEEGITVRRVECVLNAVFGQIANDAREGNLMGTHVIHLGKFIMKPFNVHRFLEQGKDGSTTKDKG